MTHPNADDIMAFARTAWELHASFRASGFTDEQAFALTSDWVKAIITPQENPDAHVVRFPKEGLS